MNYDEMAEKTSELAFDIVDCLEEEDVKPSHLLEARAIARAIVDLLKDVV